MEHWSYGILYDQIIIINHIMKGNTISVKVTRKTSRLLQKTHQLTTKLHLKTKKHIYK